MAIETIDLTGDAPPTPVKAPRRKRKAAELNDPPATAGPSKSVYLTQEDDGYGEPSSGKPKKKKAKTAKDAPEEKRLKRFRDSPPSSLKAVYDRAVNQRMFCLDRQRTEGSDHPTETLKIAGSTGNVYTITISKLPTCDCPHATKGNECKHILFALVRVLKASNYYQKAYLSSELREIFANAPPIAPIGADATDKDGNRKPISEDDTCPICFMEFENGTQGTVYCKAACGNNIHKECFQQWEASRRRSAAPVTCPFCRSRWATGDGPQGSVSMETVSQRRITGEGYVNVAEELGVSRQRDYTGYNSFWMRQRMRNGEDVGEWEDPDPSWGERYGRGYDRYGGRWGD